MGHFETLRHSTKEGSSNGLKGVSADLSLPSCLNSLPNHTDVYRLRRSNLPNSPVRICPVLLQSVPKVYQLLSVFCRVNLPVVGEFLLMQQPASDTTHDSVSANRMKQG